MGLEGNGPKGKKASGGRFFSSPGWRRHRSSADGSPTSGTKIDYSIVGLTDVRLSKVNTAAVIAPDATMINKSTGERAIPGILLKINPDPKL